MNRRGFLGAMLAAASAPAIVRAESLMKIVVPEKKIILGRGFSSPIFHIDDSAWYYGNDRDYFNEWTSGPTSLIVPIPKQIKNSGS